MNKCEQVSNDYHQMSLAKGVSSLVFRGTSVASKGVLMSDVQVG